MKQIDMAKIQVACLLDFHTGGRHIRIPRSHTWGRASSGWSTNKEGIILQAHLWSALLHIRGNEFHRNFVVSDQRIHRNFVVSENLPFKGYWQWLKCTKICIMSITDSINFKVNLEIKKKEKDNGSRKNSPLWRVGVEGKQCDLTTNVLTWKSSSLWQVVIRKMRLMTSKKKKKNPHQK